MTIFLLGCIGRICPLLTVTDITALQCPSVHLRAGRPKSRPMPASCGAAGEGIGHDCRRCGKCPFPCEPVAVLSSPGQSPVH